MLRAEKSVSEKCDVYSFAIVLWEIATGRIPWGTLGHMQILFSVGMRGERLPIPSDVQPEVAALIQDCWAEDPNQRPSFDVIIERLSSLKEIIVSAEPEEDEGDEENGSMPSRPVAHPPSLPALQGPSRDNNGLGPGPFFQVVEEQKL